MTTATHITENIHRDEIKLSWVLWPIAGKAEMVLEELRVQHLDPKALGATGCHPEHRLIRRNLKDHHSPPSKKIHLL